MLHVTMVKSVLLMVQWQMKEGLNFVTRISGGLCVMTVGVILMHKLCADSLDTL